MVLLSELTVATVGEEAGQIMCCNLSCLESATA